MIERRAGVTTRFSSPWLPAAVFLLSLSLTCWAWYVLQGQYRQQSAARFEVQRDRVVTAIQNRMLAYEHVLRGAQGLFAASVEVTRQEFHSYVANLRIGDHYPGIQGVGFAKVIAPGELIRHIQSVRDEGFPAYTMRPAGERPVYTAIIYLEPFDWRNQRAFGYDMFSEPVRRAAMVRARDTGQAAVSGKVTLVQETRADVQAGFLMYLPVYRNGASTETVAQRRAALLGYVYSPFRMDDLMRGVLGDDADSLNLKIYGSEVATAEGLMYASGTGAPRQRALPAAFTRSVRLMLGGQVWTVQISGQAGANGYLYREPPAVVFFGGCVLSLLLAGITWSVATSRDRAQALATGMTADLNAAKEAAEAGNGELSRINQALRSAASRMRALIDDLLALSRVTSQTTPFVTVDLNRVARDAVADLDARIAQTGARVEISELPRIKGDPTQLRQMFHNLIANALNFQKEGAPPHIQIFARRVAEQLPEGREGSVRAWQVCVEDNGIGFDMKYLDRIFAPFERLHGRDQYEGTGMGLAICQKIVTRHGGEITAYSKTGEGSLFMVSLPAIEASSKDKPADSAITLARSAG